MPTDWSQPGAQFIDAFQEYERMVEPNNLATLFRQATLNKYHVDTAMIIGAQFGRYIDGICSAICDGIDKWMKMATINGVVINGPVGMLMPGMVLGPPLMPLIFATAPKSTIQETKYSRAISAALGKLWQPWHRGINGLLTYPPTFAAFPGPVHPPIPNIPILLSALPSPGEAGLSHKVLKTTMEANLADPTAYHASDLFYSIARAFNTVFQTFKMSTLVKNVLGTGPVPTFAPPFVPVGPVVGGIGNGPPGCLV